MKTEKALTHEGITVRYGGHLERFLPVEGQEEYPWTGKETVQDLNSIFDSYIDYLCAVKRIPLKEVMGSIEREILVKSLSLFNGNQRRTASYLGIKTSTLNEKIRKYRIQFRKVPV